jgi:GTP-binding protein
MEPNPFRTATYLMSVHDLDGLPPDDGSEVAFVGRSNAGKSSVLNTLAEHRRLAFVSKTPGRTQLINFFSIGEGHMLVDLPGYGYAAVPAAVRAHWQSVLSGYVGSRKSLKGLVLIMDARHPLKELDWQLLEWVGPGRVKVHCILTKSDKLSKAEQAATLRKVRAELKIRGIAATAQLFSSLKRSGKEEAYSAILNMFGDK